MAPGKINTGLEALDMELTADVLKILGTGPRAPVADAAQESLTSIASPFWRTG